MTKTGERVGAILSTTTEEDETVTVNFLGFGTYAGEHVPEEATGWMAEIMREVGRTNPKIELDSGKVVYGCECWWGPEAKVQERLAKYDRINEVDIDEIRKKHRE